MILKVIRTTTSAKQCPMCEQDVRIVVTRGYFGRRGAVKEHCECARCGLRTLAYEPGRPPILYGWIRTTKGKR